LMEYLIVANENNRRLTQRFGKFYACGHSNLRIKMSDIMPIKLFIDRGKGSRFWDADGKD